MRKPKLYDRKPALCNRKVQVYDSKLYICPCKALFHILHVFVFFLSNNNLALM